MTERCTTQKRLAHIGEVVKRAPRGVLVCKVMFVVVCLMLVLDGRHPPAGAQSPSSAEMYGLELKSALQQSRADQIDDKVNKLDARMSKQWDAINSNTNAISGFQGEVRGIGAVLAMLQIGSMVFALRKGKGKDA